MFQVGDRVIITTGNYTNSTGVIDAAAEGASRVVLDNGSESVVIPNNNLAIDQNVVQPAFAPPSMSAAPAGRQTATTDGLVEHLESLLGSLRQLRENAGPEHAPSFTPTPGQDALSNPEFATRLAAANRAANPPRRNRGMIPMNHGANDTHVLFVPGGALLFFQSAKGSGAVLLPGVTEASLPVPMTPDQIRWEPVLGTTTELIVLFVHNVGAVFARRHEAGMAMVFVPGLTRAEFPVPIR